MDLAGFIEAPEIDLPQKRRKGSIQIFDSRFPQILDLHNMVSRELKCQLIDHSWSCSIENSYRD
jgi:hypothetical protein